MSGTATQFVEQAVDALGISVTREAFLPSHPIVLLGGEAGLRCGRRWNGATGTSRRGSCVCGAPRYTHLSPAALDAAIRLLDARQRPFGG